MNECNFSFFENLPRPWDEETNCCVRMWRAVIDRMVIDLTGVAGRNNKIAAEYWFDGKIMYDATSPGFDDVCDLANLPIDWTRDKINEFLKNTRAILHKSD